MNPGPNLGWAPLLSLGSLWVHRSGIDKGKCLRVRSPYHPNDCGHVLHPESVCKSSGLPGTGLQHSPGRAACRPAGTERWGCPRSSAREGPRRGDKRERNKTRRERIKPRARFHMSFQLHAPTPHLGQTNKQGPLPFSLDTQVSRHLGAGRPDNVLGDLIMCWLANT